MQMCAMTGATERRSQGARGGSSLSGKRSQTDGDAFIFDASLPLCVPSTLYSGLLLRLRNWPEKAGQKLARSYSYSFWLYRELELLDPPTSSHDNMTTKRSFTFLASMK